VSNNAKGGLQLDFASIAGLVLGPACILIGQYIEGGEPSALVQGSAALIVLGTTVGACMISFSPIYLRASIVDLRKVITDNLPNSFDLIDRIVQYSTTLAKDGPLALQKCVQTEPYELLAKGLNLLISNISPESIAAILERSYNERSRLNNAGAEVFEAAGGYLPTFGILGAVLGLIHTMSQLSDPSKVGVGIATAFVATVYGVGTANLIAYPVAKKIRSRAQKEIQLDRIVITGIKGMQSGLKGTALRQLLTGGTASPSASVKPVPKAA
jgi:chemotaxis protein MotA